MITLECGFELFQEPILNTSIDGLNLNSLIVQCAIHVIRSKHWI